MSDITPLGRSHVPIVNTTVGDRPASTHAAAPANTDRVEVSSHARLLSKLSDLPEVREDLVERVRGEIAAGTYLTDDKIDAILDDLARDLA